MLLVLIILILVFGGGGIGYRVQGIQGGSISAVGILLIILVVLALTGRL